MSYSGFVVNKHNQNPQSGVNVSVFVTESSSNGVVGKPKLLASAVSSEDGRFSMNFERSAAIDYRVDVDGIGVFPSTFSLSPEKVIEAKNFESNIELNVVSYARLKIKNIGEAQSTDEINIGTDIVLPCDCCPKTALTFRGLVDSTFVCKIPAGLNVIYNAVTRDGNGLGVLSDSVFCSKLDTCTLEINF